MRVVGTIVACLFLCGLAVPAAAQDPGPQRKGIADVQMESLAQDSQKSAENTPDNHLNLVWWIPQEFWAASFAQEGSLTPAARDDLLRVLEKYSMLAIVQADVGTFGQFKFYDRAKVAGALEVEVESPTGTIKLQASDADAELEPLIAVISPILASAMGNLGANMHFFVLEDRGQRSDSANASVRDSGAGSPGKPSDRRVLDPYEQNTIRVAIKTTAGERLVARIETPLNSLFVPRMCPNGKPAHVSWKFCPWNGERLR